MKKILCFLLCTVFLTGAFYLCTAGVKAKETLCKNITSACKITLNGEKMSSGLKDNNEETYIEFESAEIVIEAPEPVGGVYIKFDRTPPEWTLTYKGKDHKCGTYGFLHEYQSVEADNVSALTLKFTETVSFADIFVISKGDRLPDFVQTWRPAEGRCDIMLLSCHSDDDQLFFAGSVPDAVNRGAEMQVCYFTHHWKTHTRPHELLNGLWTCGLDRYPVIGRFPDITRVDSEEGMLEVFVENGYTYDEMVADQVELLRKYKPQIVLVHDIKGEYGHGAHILDSHTLRDAAEVSNDLKKYPDSAKKYGVWDVPKIYIHLYKENEIDFEIDVPLDRFGGRTAYQVSQDAFRCHLSQLDTRFTPWLLGTKENPITDAHDFPDYCPRYYGLWKSTVGEDVKKTDFYENIVLLADMPAETIPETTAKTTAEPAVTTTEPEVTTTEPETTTAEETTTEEATEAEPQTETVTETETDKPETTAKETTDAETAAKTITDEQTAEPKKTPEKKNGRVYIIIICSVCLIAVAAAAFAIVKRKNKAV